MKIYVASGLENATQVRRVMDQLEAAGHTITYDWTKHGPVYKPSLPRGVNVPVIRDTATKELQGVAAADAVVGWLPGGKGTHVELGAALALHKPVLLASDVDPYHAKPHPCAFWFHPGVLLHVVQESVDLRRMQVVGIINGWSAFREREAA